MPCVPHERKSIKEVLRSNRKQGKRKTNKGIWTLERLFKIKQVSRIPTPPPPPLSPPYAVDNKDSEVITSAEREVKDSRRSGMYQSYHFVTRLDVQSL